jgi:hypothetical protein
MTERLVSVKQLGPNGMGYAYKMTGERPSVGLCARHRADGVPRLVFDLTVNYQRYSPLYDLPHSHGLAVEFALDRQLPLPPHISVLIGRRTWADLSQRAQPPGSDSWRDWGVDSDITSFWRGATVSLLPWSVELRWPILRVGSGLIAPRTGIIAYELALWSGTEYACLLNENWMRAGGAGELIVDDADETTCFFPALQRFV